MRDIPQHDRPRERLLRHGPAALGDAELIAIHLGSGHAGASAIDVAHHLLTAVGGVRGLAAARPEELARIPGVGPAKATRLVAALALSARVRDSADTRTARLVRSSDIAAEAGRVIGPARVEQVAVLIADHRLNLQRTEVLAIGSAGACPVPVREIVATTLRHDGATFAVAHNHPSGDPTPSAADRAATLSLQEAARATGLRFLDHVVVCGGDWRSAT